MNAVARPTERHPPRQAAREAPDASPDHRLLWTLIVSVLLGACVWAGIGVAVHALLTG